MAKPRKFLKTHLDLIEKSLLCLSDIATSSGHPVHKGTLRENFIRDFLTGHIGEDMGVSSGEVFDASRVVGTKANQIDVIIYTKNFPKIRIVSQDINAFMAESVHATIEIKSLLKKQELTSTFLTAHNIRRLKNEIMHTNRRAINCYLVAYSATASISTVANWLSTASKTAKHRTDPNALAGVFVLGKGFVVSPGIAAWMKDRKSNQFDPIGSSGQWIYVEQETGNLYALFFALNFFRYGIDIRHYFEGVLPPYKIV